MYLPLLYKIIISFDRDDVQDNRPKTNVRIVNQNGEKKTLAEGYMAPGVAQLTAARWAKFFGVRFTMEN